MSLETLRKRLVQCIVKILMVPRSSALRWKKVAQESFEAVLGNLILEMSDFPTGILSIE